MEILKYILMAVFAVMTVVGFVVMAVDKVNSKKGKTRIKEFTLFKIALFMGGVGTTLGMYLCHHKTKHWYFMVFMPLLALLNVAIVVVGWIYLI